MKRALSSVLLLPFLIPQVVNAEGMTVNLKNSASGFSTAAASSASCQAILDGGGSTGDGVYQIDPDGDGSSFDVWCDMTTDGGGWTLVAAQFEGDPLNNWNEGITADYDPSLATSRSFTLSTAELPPHTQTAFGKDLDPTFIDYAAFTYSTGNIASTRVTGVLTGYSYDIHRHATEFFSGHDPEGTFYSNVWSMHFNTLTFDRSGGSHSTWAFQANPDTGVDGRGYSMNGDYLISSPESYAWTVWVR